MEIKCGEMHACETPFNLDSAVET
ncbi:MAG: hypothetical protein ACD_42C00216G0001, partial [uncultured bacterium]